MSFSANNITQPDRWGRPQRAVRWGMVLTYMATIFFLSSLSGSSVPVLKISDKVLHAVEFGGLALLVCRAVRAQAPAFSSRLVAMVSILSAIGYGITDELHQLFVPNRMMDFTDVAADSLGALLAAWVWMKVGRHWPWLQ